MVEYVEKNMYFYERGSVLMQQYQENRNPSPSASSDPVPLTDNSGTASQSQSDANKGGIESRDSTFRKEILLVIISVILTAFIGAVGFIIVSTYNFKEKTNIEIATINTLLDNMNDSIDNVKEEIVKIDESRENIIDIQGDIERTKEDIAAIKKALFSIPGIVLIDYKVINPEESLVQFISSFKNNEAQEFPMYTMSTNFSENTIIGTDENGKELSFAELEGVPFCTHYKENGVETWFYGKLNEKGNWDGFCVMNDYVGDKLVALFESSYNDGVRVGEYKSMLREGEQYILSNRTYHGDYNTGETYICKDLQLPGITLKSDKPVRYEDCFASELISYYNGRTSNGKYNDKTGTAFNIIYNEDNTVRIFYQGCFSNGNFVDDRPLDSSSENTAFWIILANDDSQYLYYKGPFSNGHPVKKDWHEEKDARIGISESPDDRLLMRSDYPKLKWRTWLTEF